MGVWGWVLGGCHCGVFGFWGVVGGRTVKGQGGWKRFDMWGLGKMRSCGGLLATRLSRWLSGGLDKVICDRYIALVLIDALFPLSSFSGKCWSKLCRFRRESLSFEAVKDARGREMVGKRRETRFQRL